jgi:hypothetical protein
VTFLDNVLQRLPRRLRPALKGLWYAILLFLALFFAFDPQAILPYARF